MPSMMGMGMGRGSQRGSRRGMNMNSDPAKDLEKAKDLKGSLLRMFGYFSKHKAGLTVVLFVALISSVFGILTPKILGKAMDILYHGFTEYGDTGEFNIDFGSIALILAILAGLYVLNAVFMFLQQYLLTGIGQKVMYTMRCEVMEKLTKLPISFFDKNARGDILSRVSNDIDNVGGTLQNILVEMITSVITLVGVFIMMLIISPTLTLVVLATIPLLLVVTSFIAKHSQKYFSKQWDTLGNLNGHVEEMFSGADVVRAFGYTDESVKKFSVMNEELFYNSRKAQFISGLVMPFMHCINNLAFVLICVIGGMKVVSGRITFGDVTAFIQYQKQFTSPVQQMSNMINVIQSSMASAERVFEILDSEEETEREILKHFDAPVKGEVTFEHVSFGYSPEKILIKDMNIVIKPGQMVAIVGPTGAGKTTLVNLLMRFYEINSGSIKVDGIDIRDFSRQELRDIFGMVLQETWLFSGTISDNIAYGAPNKRNEAIVRAAKAAYVDHFIKSTPKSYGTILNEEGTNISQGQKQLLTIARAMISMPQILILDEATSSVDTRTESLIQKAMEQLLKGHTSFVIAHRLSTIKNADIILVMRDGDIVESGNHNELIEKKGFYYELYNSQFVKGGEE